MKLTERFINKNVKIYNKHNLGFNIGSKVMERRLIENHMKIHKTNRLANQMLYRTLLNKNSVNIFLKHMHNSTCRLN